MKKVLYFSSSNRTYTPLNNVYTEGIKRDIASFFLYNDETQEKWPQNDISQFKYSSNCYFAVSKFSDNFY